MFERPHRKNIIDTFIQGGLYEIEIQTAQCFYRYLTKRRI